MEISAGFAALCICLFAAATWLFIEDQLLRPLPKDLLLRRLKAYALLCKSAETEKSAKEDERLLDAASHAILLGTLKKVEQKSQTLLAVTIFGLAASLSIWADMQFPLSMPGVSVLLVSGALVPALLAGLLGMVQLDTCDLVSAAHLDDTQLMQKLQADLVHDLYRKELAFRFAWNWTVFVIMFLTVSLLIYRLFYH